MSTLQPKSTGRLENLGSIDHLQTSGDQINRNSNITMVGHNSISTSSPTSSRPDSSSQNHTDPDQRRSSVSGSTPPNNGSPSSPNRKLPAKGLWGKVFNSELGRLGFSLLYFVVVCIGMAFCNQFSDHRWVETSYTKVYLEDRGFDIFPAQKDITPANVFVMTSVIFTLVAVALICPTWTARIIVLRRVFWVVGTLSVYRALTLSVTTMPTPKVDCVPATEKGFKAMFWIALQMIPGTVQACTDDIFSGHTVFMVTCAIQWRLYCRNKWITYFTYIYITVGLYFVVATRLHYTVDVVLAIFITYAVWSLYIATIDVVMEKEYFGIRRHREKYMAFDGRWAEENEQEQRFGRAITFGEDDNEKGIVAAEQSSTGFAARRAQLQYRMNRFRGAGMGYDRGEHDRVAFVPMQYNIWLTRAVRWCDGLDLRMANEGFSGSRWEALVVDHRIQIGAPTTDPVFRKISGDKTEIDEEPAALESIQVEREPQGPSAAGTR